ncbi:hypothetical protein LSTR_LSTR008587 [Laodelphax striatellus]|uniref:Uncharacterized protein n=1 Tax=Laodelphax striatellus TaxID=195883 RepID=A0A482WVA7_LAOST|nr:hypothetical protein LSTR_LSTR008587 [Laodelphax striatellus]
MQIILAGKPTDAELTLPEICAPRMDNSAILMRAGQPNTISCVHIAHKFRPEHTHDWMDLRKRRKKDPSTLSPSVVGGRKTASKPIALLGKWTIGVEECCGCRLHRITPLPSHRIAHLTRSIHLPHLSNSSGLATH